MKILWFDTETTGLDPIKNDIIQIAGLVDIDGEIVDEFEFKCQPFDYQAISPQAMKVHGYEDLEVIRGWDEPTLIHSKLTGLFGKYVDKFNRKDKFIPAGHNVKFDIDMLRNFFFKSNDKYFGSFFDYHNLDTISAYMVSEYAGIVEKPESYRLEVLADKYGIEIKAHDALSDIQATRELFLNITHQIKNGVA